MKKLLLIATGASIIFGACNSKDPVPSGGNDEKVEVNLDGNIAETISGIPQSWKDGDEISAFVGYSNTSHQLNVLYSASNASGVKADFTTKIKKVEEQSTYVAFYPYSSTNTYDATAGTVSFSLPAVQNHVVDGVAAGALPLVARSTSTSLQFKQVCGIFRIALAGSAKINSIEIEGVKIAGNGSVNASTTAVTMGADASDKITYNIQDAVTLGETPTVFNVILPPGQYATLYYTVFAEDGSQMSAFDENVTISVGAVTEAASTSYVPDGQEAGRVDLSDEGYANCYVVNAPGDYSFDCVMPDSKKTVVAGEKADWVWATSGAWASQEEASAEKIVKDIAYDAENNVITFSVPEEFTYGNVLIALIDKDDFISYGWHIWVTPRITTVTVNGVELMDRNLGAAGTIDIDGADVNFVNNCRGLMYQWARKDAQIGGRTGNLSETEIGTPGPSTFYVTNSGIKQVSVWPSSETDAGYPWVKAVPHFVDEEEGHAYEASLLNAGKFPCTFINGQANHPAHGLDKWPEEANPCPVGYTVPTIEQMWKLFEAGKTSVSVKRNDKTEDAVTVIDNVLFFPMGGYRNIGLLTGAGVDGRYWTAQRNPEAGGSGTANHGYWFQIGNGSEENNFLKEGNANKLHSGFIRCVKK